MATGTQRESAERGLAAGRGLGQGALALFALRPWLLYPLGGAFVLCVRGLYLVRFGWDAGWMNWGYLAYGKVLALHGVLSMEEPPLTPVLLFLARRVGLSALQALGAVYLVAHLGLALATLGLGDFVWPSREPRRRLILLLLVAVTPLLSTVAGYRNLGALVGAATLASALALGVTAAGRPRLSLATLAGAASCSLLAGTARFEALAGVLCGAVVLVLLGRRFSGVRWPRSAGLALLLGGLLSLAVERVVEQPRTGPSVARTYALYTFYDGLPYLLWPSLTDDDEFARYRTSLQYFGTDAENHGSLAQALVRHPFSALLRTVLKPVDFLGALGWVGSLTPLGLLFVWLGLRKVRWRMESGQLERGWAMLAYAAPFALLWVPASAPPYFLTVAPPLLLAMARGVDRATERLPHRGAGLLGVAAVAAALLAIACFGKRDVASSPVFTDAAAYLEEECAHGCLANFLPQALRMQAWVELEAGSPFPTLAGRSEGRVLGVAGPDYEKGFDFTERIRRSRADGFRGPVLYVRSDVKSFHPFHEVFDQELKWEGPVDVSGARLLHRFARNEDEVVVYEVEPRAPSPP